MKYRHALLLSPTDLGEAGTKIIDIDVNKPISRINIRFKTTKANYAMSVPAPANISKIELVDGSKLLHSLSGYENQALAYYSRGNISMEHGQHIPTLAEVDMYALDFGRHLWDELLAFNPLRFDNPQLKITWDEDVSDTGVSANECEVWADIFDEKEISPLGFLVATEHYSYTPSAADAYEEVSLPSDRLIRQILVRAYQDGYEPWYNIDEIRFDEGTLDKIPWEYTDLEMYYRRMKSVWPMIQTPLVIEPTTSARVYYVPQTDFWAFVVGIPMAVAPSLYVNGTSMRGGKLSAIASASEQVAGMACGYLPWHCYQFPMGKLDDIDDWYDPTDKKPRLRLRASTGGSSVTGYVILEELYRY